MRAQSYGFQGTGVGLKDHFLGNSLTPGVVAEKIPGIGSAFVHPAQIVFLVNNRRRTGIDQGGDAMCATGIQDVLGANNIGCVIIIFIAPETGLGGKMEYGVIPGQAILQKISIADIAGKKSDAQGFCFGEGTPRDNACLNAIARKALHQRPADKATSAKHHNTLHPLSPFRRDENFLYTAPPNPLMQQHLR
jgi:hypothetical protein